MSSLHFPRMTRIAGIFALGLGVGLALSACSPSTSSAAGAPSASATTATVSRPAATASRPSCAHADGRGRRVPVAIGNISCEVDYQSDGLTKAYCQTAAPARSVTMDASGKYTTCTGQQCLGNPGDGTPTLAYGTATGVGPFSCESAVTGITCLANGKGFRISASGTVPVTA